MKASHLRILKILSGVSLASLSGLILVDAFSSGAMSFRGQSYSRSEAPGEFYFKVVLLCWMISLGSFIAVKGRSDRGG
jgi:hypothetical protein